jgi:hypothetical protein
LETIEEAIEKQNRTVKLPIGNWREIHSGDMTNDDMNGMIAMILKAD